MFRYPTKKSTPQKGRQWKNPRTVFSFLATLAMLGGALTLLAAAKAGVPSKEEDGDDPRQRSEWFEKARISTDRESPASHRFKAAELTRKMTGIVAPGGRGTLRGMVAPMNIPGAGGCDWQEIGPNPLQSLDQGNVSGRVTSLVLDPRDTTGNTLYVGTAYGGVWKTTNAMSASPQYSPLSDPNQSLAVGAIAVDGSANPSVLYVGSGEPNEGRSIYYGVGIFKFSNGSWSLVSSANGPSGPVSLFGLTFARITVDPVNPQILLAAAQWANPKRILGETPSYGLYRSTDAGGSWNYVTTNITGTNFSTHPCTDVV